MSNLQVILPLEGLAAELAREASLVAVRQPVIGQVRRTGEHLGAHLLEPTDANVSSI